MNTHRAIEVGGGKSFKYGKYVLVSNTYHCIQFGGEFSDGWCEVDIKTLEEI